MTDISDRKIEFLGLDHFEEPRSHADLQLDFNLRQLTAHAL
jgi:hypothetical protein